MTADKRTDKGGRAGDSVRVGGLITLAEAGYLRDALLDAGIAAAISGMVGKEGTNEPRHAVVVAAAELSAALELRQRFLPETSHGPDRGLLTPKPTASPLGKAAGAGLLGMVVGLRVGHGSPQLTALYCLGLGLIAFLGVLLSVSGGPRRRGRGDAR